MKNLQFLENKYWVVPIKHIKSRKEGLIVTYLSSLVSKSEKQLWKIDL